ALNRASALGPARPHSGAPSAREPAPRSTIAQRRGRAAPRAAAAPFRYGLGLPRGRAAPRAARELPVHPRASPPKGNNDTSSAKLLRPLPPGGLGEREPDKRRSRLGPSARPPHDRDRQRCRVARRNLISRWSAARPRR